MAEKKPLDYSDSLTANPLIGRTNGSSLSTDISDYPGGKGEAGHDPELGEAMDANRVQWGGQIEFILTCVGYAVGLGNVWRFPYLAFRNGGGAFLIPYIIMLAVVGLPLFFMELALGQFASLGPLAIWRINPLLKGVGYCSVWVSWLIALYYNVIIGHCLFYLAASFNSELPWQHCGHSWNTANCTDSVPRIGANGAAFIYNNISNQSLTTMTSTILNSTPMTSTGLNSTPMTSTPMTSNPMTSTEEYYYNYVLERSDTIDDMGGVSWKLALSLLVAWIIVCLVLIKGISSLGKVVYFTAIFPYVMLCILFIRGVTLKGAGLGMLYYITPVFEKLKEPKVWSDAATQIFYSLSACSGGLIAMSSYNKFNNNCYRDSLIVALINCGTSVFAGLVIFSVLGFMAIEKGVDIENVVKGGPGLAFIVYPEALARMPVAPLWSVFFFIMMATLGFGSQFSIVECILSAFTDEFPKYLKPRRNNIIFRIAACTAMFLLGILMISRGGSYILDLVDGATGGFPLLFVGLFELVAVNHIYGYQRFASDIEMMLGSKPNIYWQINWRAVSPLAILAVLISNMVYYKPPGYPQWAVSLSWCIAMWPIVWIPGWFIGYFIRYGGLDILKINSMPLSTWGPNHPEHRNLEPDVYQPVTQSDSTLNRPQMAKYRNYTPGYIQSIASDLNSAIGSKQNLSLSETSGAEGHSDISPRSGEDEVKLGDSSI